MLAPVTAAAQCVLCGVCRARSLLSIQNMMGGGKPAGGWQGSTKETPSWTTNGLIFSFDHKGDPGTFRGATRQRAGAFSSIWQREQSCC